MNNILAGEKIENVEITGLLQIKRVVIGALILKNSHLSGGLFLEGCIIRPGAIVLDGSVIDEQLVITGCETGPIGIGLRNVKVGKHVLIENCSAQSLDLKGIDIGTELSLINLNTSYILVDWGNAELVHFSAPTIPLVVVGKPKITR